MTTHVDRQNERFSVGALKSVIAQLERAIIPVGLEHDPRIPPHGRVVSAELRELDDSEFGVHGVMELFEPGEKIPLSADPRSIPIHDYEPGVFRLAADRNFRNPIDRQAIQDLEGLLRCHAKEDIKKAFDPLTILTVAGSFVLGGVAVGFLNALGADGYQALKGKLSEIFARKTAARAEALLCFEFILEKDGYIVAVEAILTNPTAADIDRFLGSGLRELDRLVLDRFSADEGVKRVVFQLKDGRLQLSFMVRRDAVPIFPEA